MLDYYFQYKEKNITWKDLYIKLNKALPLKEITTNNLEKISFYSILSKSNNLLEYDKQRDREGGSALWFRELVAIVSPEFVIDYIEEVDAFFYEDEPQGNVYISLNPYEFDREWEDIRDFYFKCNGYYYTFRIFYNTAKDNMHSIVAIVNNWMEILGRPERFYEIFMGSICYFCANPKYFNELILEYEIPARMVTFLQPFDTVGYLRKFNLLEDRLKVHKYGGYKDDVSGIFVATPKANQQTSNKIAEWIKQQQPLFARIISNRKKMSDTIIQAIHIRNLFIAVARDGIYNKAVVAHLYKYRPLWSNSEYEYLIAKYPTINFLNELLAEIFNVSTLVSDVSCQCNDISHQAAP